MFSSVMFLNCLKRYEQRKRDREGEYDKCVYILLCYIYTRIRSTATLRYTLLVCAIWGINEFCVFVFFCLPL